MKRSSFGLVAILGVMAAAPGSAPAWAQSHDFSPPPTGPSRDDRVMGQLAEKKHGVIMITAAVGPGRRCETIKLHFGRRDPEGKWRVGPGLMAAGWFFGNQTHHALVWPMSPGETHVLGVACKLGNNITNLTGPHAKFTVNAGELVNVGLLRINYETQGGFFQPKTGTSQKAIEPMSAETKAKLREEYPKAYPKAVQRLMTLVGPAETNIRQR
jgi:hypothetical protein